MKKLLIAVLALLMLTACSKEQEAAAPPVEEPEVVHTPVEEEKIPEEPETAPVEIPTEIVDPESAEPAEEPEDSAPFQWEITHVEGLVEDTVAYDLELPVFSDADGADQINDFYEKVIDQLVTHTKENVYLAVMEKHTMANVYGTMLNLSWEEDWVEVEYEYRLEFLDDSAPDFFTRTDRFDLQTGERISSESE